MAADEKLWNRGLVHVYTGNGKGKTTAALGLALRAAGAGLDVRIVQFMKASETGELEALKRLSDRITVCRFGKKEFVRDRGAGGDREEAKKGLETARDALLSGRYRLVILDEILPAIEMDLLSTNDVLNLMDLRHPGTELVLTGRNAPAELIEAADLVTEMREVKHYHSRGLPARRGIEY
jgi:cob(I)alamin adenosyltransferase